MRTTSPVHRLVSLLFLFSLPLSCTTAPEWAGSLEREGGIEIISNPERPLLAQTEGLVSELWTAQGIDWVNPTLVHSYSGSIAIIDPRANRIHLLSSTGEEKGGIGRPGGGPGEFLNLLDAFQEGERLVVLDAGKGSVQYLDLEGHYLSSLHLQGQPWAGFTLADGELVVKGEFLSDPREESYGDWVTVGEGGEPQVFTSVALDPLPEEEGVVCSDLYSWDGGASRLRFTTPQIQVFDEAGALQWESRVALPVEPVTEEEREAALEELRQSLAARGVPAPFVQQSLVVSEERWRVKCRFGPLRFDPIAGYGAFLEQNPDRFGSGSATLHFLSGEGVYLARASFPRAWRDFTMEDGAIYALTRHPTTDVVSLTAYRVHLPETWKGDAEGVLEKARGRAVRNGQ